MKEKVKAAGSLPWKHNFGYNLGNLSNSLMFTMVAMYLTYFYTDYLKIGAAMAGTLFLVARTWDALNDPIMGYLVDQTHSRWGRFRPYILFGAIPVAVFFVLCFYVPDMSLEGRIIWAFATYIPLGMAQTLTLIPWHAQMVVITKDPAERSGVAGLGMVLFQLGALIVAALAIPLKGLFPKEIGFFAVAAIFAGVGTIAWYISFASTRKYDLPANYERENRETTGLADIRSRLEVIKTNKPFLLLIAVEFLAYTAITVTQATIIYFFRYYLKMESLFAPIMGGFALMTAIGAMTMATVSKKKGKRKIYMLSCVGFSVFMLAVFISFRVHGTTEPYQAGFIWFFSILVLIAGFFNGPLVALIWSLMPDTVEYGEWKTGIRSEGVLYSVFSFIMKAGAAVGGALTGFLLAFFKYVPNQEQTDETKFGILLMLFICPIVLQMLAFLVMMIYDLDEDRHREIVSELEQRKKIQ